MTAPSLVTKLLKAFVPPSAVAGEATARASAKFRPDAREAASSQTVSYDSALATILFPSRDTSTLGARRRAANVMGTNRKKSSSKKRPCGEKRGGIPGAIAIPDSDDDATESTPTATTHDAPRETEAPMDVDDANEAVGELLRRIRSTQTRPNGWCDDVRSGIMLELAEFPGVTWTSTTLAFDHATLVKNHRVCDLHSRLSVIPIDDAMHEQPGVRAVTEYLARALDEGMVRKALLKDKEGKMLSKSRDTGEYMRRTLRNPNYPMEVTLWQVIALECKVGKALYEFMAKRAKMDLCKSDAEKTRCERELAEVATFLYTNASEMGDHGLIYAETVDKAGVGEKGAHFARLAARCWRGCAMLYERGADMREYESSTNRTLRQVAEDIRHCVGACAGNLANLYHHGSLNSPEHYGVSYRDSRATASQRALCIYFLEKAQNTAITTPSTRSGNLFELAAARQTSGALSNCTKWAPTTRTRSRRTRAITSVWSTYSQDPFMKTQTRHFGTGERARWRTTARKVTSCAKWRCGLARTRRSTSSPPPSSPSSPTSPTGDMTW